MDSVKHLSTFLSSALLSFFLFHNISKHLDDSKIRTHVCISGLHDKIKTMEEKKEKKDHCSCEKLEKKFTSLQEQVGSLESKLSKVEDELRFQIDSPQGQHIATLEASTLSL